MKRVIFFFIAISALVACGPSKPLSPEEQAELNVKKAKYRDIFQSQSFALEANTVYNKKGQSMHVNSTINFVLLKEGTGTLQLGFDQLVGWNGVGGLTLDGNVRNYKVKKGDDNSMPQVSFDMNGTLGWATVRINVNSSGMARAVVDGNFGDRITFAGQMSSLEESSIYKGSTLF